jgi:hypothetical protein
MNLKLLAIAFFSVASLQARSELALTDKCPGWQVVEQTDKHTIVQHDCTSNNRSKRSVQTIQITNNAPVTIDTLHIGDVYVLVPGPYGWDQYLLNGTLPHNFPQNYLRKCCWLRQTRAGNYTITHSAEFNPEELLVSNQR